jgi:hypothetical protein
MMLMKKKSIYSIEHITFNDLKIKLLDHSSFAQNFDPLYRVVLRGLRYILRA